MLFPYNITCMCVCVYVCAYKALYFKYHYIYIFTTLYFPVLKYHPLASLLMAENAHSNSQHTGE